MAPVGVGVVVGLVGSIGVSRLLVALVTTPGSMDLLFGVSPTDPLAYTAVSLFLATVAMLAAALPAWRATQVSPMSVLRHE